MILAGDAFCAGCRAEEAADAGGGGVDTARGELLTVAGEVRPGEYEPAAGAAHLHTVGRILSA